MDWLHHFIGNDSQPIEWWQMTIRAVIIFVYLLVLVRIGGRRAFGRLTPFDIVLGILLGSALSRCLTGNAPFLPTLAAAGALMALHMALAALALRWETIGFLVKGREMKLMEDGRLLRDNLRRARVTERDLREQLRSTMNTDDLTQAGDAYLERGGDVSFVRER